MASAAVPGGQDRPPGCAASPATSRELAWA